MAPLRGRGNCPASFNDVFQGWAQSAARCKPQRAHHVNSATASPIASAEYMLIGVRRIGAIHRVESGLFTEQVRSGLFTASRLGLRTTSALGVVHRTGPLG